MTDSQILTLEVTAKSDPEEVEELEDDALEAVSSRDESPTFFSSFLFELSHGQSRHIFLCSGPTCTCKAFRKPVCTCSLPGTSYMYTEPVCTCNVAYT